MPFSLRRRAAIAALSLLALGAFVPVAHAQGKAAIKGALIPAF
jgi:D-methionine transport system substrate-binding protein